MNGYGEASNAYANARNKGRWSLENLLSDDGKELVALSKLVPDIDQYREQKVGLREIDVDKIVGTVYPGRTNSFTKGFMPTMEEGSEFAGKWISLYESFLDIGIRDAIKVYEYMGLYYVLEGNKRVSVLKYSEQAVALADIYRKVPPYDENNEEIKLYYEYMHFEEISGLNNIFFKMLGNADKFLAAVNEETWSDITKENIRSYVYRVERIFDSLRKKPENYTIGDACVTLFSIFGYENCLEADEYQTREQILKAWSEISILDNKEGVSLVTDQSDLEKKNLLSKAFSPKLTKPKIAFLYGSDIDTSRYAMNHEKGRLELQNIYGDRIETYPYANVVGDRTGNEAVREIEDTIKEAISGGCKLIFTTEGYMAQPTLKIALEHPECYFFNCSINHMMSAVRCYQVRMYEIKFLLGAIAAQISDTDLIGYEADFPINGTCASINAFARGARMINPRAKIELKWAQLDGYERDTFDTEKIKVIMGSELMDYNDMTRPYGLYINHKEELSIEHLGLAAISINWGRFYEKILDSVLEGLFNPKGKKAVNYWWGFEEGVVQIVKSRRLPESVRRMNNYLTKGIIDGSLTPFSGTIINQAGEIVTNHGGLMNLKEIMEIDYLEDNIIGEIPPIERFNRHAQMILGKIDD